MNLTFVCQNLSKSKKVKCLLKKSKKKCQNGFNEEFLDSMMKSFALIVLWPVFDGWFFYFYFFCLEVKRWGINLDQEAKGIIEH